MSAICSTTSGVVVSHRADWIDVAPSTPRYRTTAYYYTVKAPFCEPFELRAMTTPPPLGSEVRILVEVVDA